jgi:hypothetical protein
LNALEVNRKQLRSPKESTGRYRAHKNVETRESLGHLRKQILDGLAGTHGRRKGKEEGYGQVKVRSYRVDML